MKAREFAFPFHAGPEAAFAALLHDSGKYGEPFQARLRGEVSGIDHWSIGARLAVKERNADAWAAALAIEGHHTGLLCGEPNEINRRLTKPGPNWAVADAVALKERLRADGLPIDEPYSPLVDAAGRNSGKNVALMLAVRMLFSALTDADFLATERHFDGTERPAAPPLDAARIEELVERELEALRQKPGLPDHIRDLRREVGDACRRGADLAPGLFTLAAPTGSGKTLAMLLFAARHARQHRKRRIVVALPYLTITDQTVKIYRGVLGPWLESLPEGAGLLEHHSLAAAAETPGANADLERRRELLAENWDAPVVITTTVQLLESLFSNRPAACRKLHRLSESILLLDEVQTIPSELAVPTLAALSCLAGRFGTTAVLSTATQPAFRRLDEAVRDQAEPGWQPRELCAPERKLFSRVRRYRVEWLARDGATEDDALVEKLLEFSNEGSVLLIANLKRQAIRWFRHLRRCGLARVEHISTNLTAFHRRRVLGYWADRANSRNPGQVLVTTQCIEAGVDLDFPAAFRAFAPLDSLAQAAGRVNRNGLLAAGRLVVFEPSETGIAYPDHAYSQAAGVGRTVLAAAGWPVDLERPELFERYFARLYDARGTKERSSTRSQEFDDALKRFDFPQVADLYRLIPKRDVIHVLCPDGSPEFAALRNQGLNGRLTRDWIRGAQPHSVEIFRPRDESALDAVMLNHNERSGDWFVLHDPQLYDSDLGLQIDSTATIA